MEFIIKVAILVGIIINSFYLLIVIFVPREWQSYQIKTWQLHYKAARRLKILECWIRLAFLVTILFLL